MDRREEGRGATDESLAREHLANERTLLSWVRIGTNSMGVGILLYLFVSLAGDFPSNSIVREIMPAESTFGRFESFAVVIVIFGTFVQVTAFVRFLQFRKVLDRGEFTSSAIVYVLLVLAFGILGVSYITYVVVS